MELIKVLLDVNGALENRPVHYKQKFVGVFKSVIYIKQLHLNFLIECQRIFHSYENNY